MSKDLATPAARRNSGNQSSRSSRRSRRGGDATPTKISVPNHFFTSRNKHLNCFKFGLDPNDEAHRRVICDGCLYALSKTTNGIVTNDLINEPRGYKKKMCEKPWHMDWKDHPDGGKVQRHEDFLNMFTTEPELVDATTIAGYAKIEAKAAATTDGRKQVAFKERIELELKKAQRYKEFLDEELADTRSAVARQHEIMSDIAARTEELEGVQFRLESEFGLSPNEEKELEDREEQLKAELQQLRSRAQSDVDANMIDVDDRIDYATMLIESLCITND